VNDRGPDQGTESFYQIERVAEEYEVIRFEHPGGRLINSLQKEAVLAGVDSLNLTGKKVLDVACGTGRLNQSRIRQSAEAYVEASALRLPFKDGSFDIAVSVNAFNHIPSFEDAIDEICRVSNRVILGLPNRHSFLLLAYLYRILRGWGYGYTRHKATRYKGTPLIYTRYFSRRELEEIFKKNQFEVIRCPKCWVFPFPYVPGSLIEAVQILEKMAARSLGRFGTFMAMVAERR
jgi:ubiquinone/menaquinone biosynthesis C-methylase UbiE